MNNNLNLIKERISPILKKSGVVKAGIFGSYARGEENKKSDIDILIKISKDKSLLDIIELKFALEEELDIKVDLVEYTAIKPLIRERVLKEEVAIL